MNMGLKEMIAVLHGCKRKAEARAKGLERGNGTELKGVVDKSYKELLRVRVTEGLLLSEALMSEMERKMNDAELAESRLYGGLLRYSEGAKALDKIINN
jgi:hypothetical protein